MTEPGLTLSIPVVFPADRAYIECMADLASIFDPEDEEAAELAALTAAVAEADADPRPSISHEKVRAWLLEIAAGNFDAPPPLSE